MENNNAKNEGDFILGCIEDGERAGNEWMDWYLTRTSDSSERMPLYLKERTTTALPTVSWKSLETSAMIIEFVA